MPRTYTTTHTVYKYAELSDVAKANARDWWREASAGDNDFAEFVTDDFLAVLKALGFDPYARRGNYLDPRDPRGRRLTLEWSGFASQGDGAAFGGTWRASDCDPAGMLADRPATYERDGKRETCVSNAQLHEIAARIVACKNQGLEFASLSVSNRGYFMSLDSTEHAQPDDLEVMHETLHDAYIARCAEIEGTFITAARDLASWFYKALEDEYTYQNSDEQVAETIEANEYEFTAEGKIT